MTPRAAPALSLLLLAGCAVSPPPEYRPPAAAPAQRAVPTAPAGTAVAEIDATREAVWKRIVERARGSGFGIEAADEQRGEVRLRYIGEPRNYLECGTLESKVVTAKGEQHFNFPASKAYQRYQFQKDSVVYVIDRRMSVTILATLRLESLSPSRTRASVRASYQVTRDQSVTGGGRKAFALTDTINFDGGARATFPNAPTACQATGTLERDALALAGR